MDKSNYNPQYKLYIADLNATVCFASKKIFYREILKDLYQHSDEFDFTSNQKSQIHLLINALEK